METFARRLVLDVGAGEVRIGEISPDKKGFPVFTMKVVPRHFVSPFFTKSDGAIFTDIFVLTTLSVITQHLSTLKALTKTLLAGYVFFNP